MVDQHQAPKKKRGRPKRDPNAPKATYHFSSLEKARIATRKRIRDAKKRAERTTKRADDKKAYAKRLEKSVGKVEDALKGQTSRLIDKGDLQNIPSAVSDLVDEYERSFYRQVKEMYCMAEVPEEENHLPYWQTRCGFVTILLIVACCCVALLMNLQNS